jgi:hypothetical protein
MECEFVRASDVAYINDITREINGAVERAAAVAGVRFVAMYEAFDGHELCTSQRWIHGIDKTDAAFGPQDPFFHPTVAGQLEYRNRLVDAMFGRPSSQVQTMSAAAQPALTPSEGTVHAGAPFSFVGSGYQPGTEVEAVFDWGSSAPRTLGTAIADQDGRVAMTITVPADASPGEHDLTAWGLNDAGYNVGPRASLSVVAEEQ